MKRPTIFVISGPSGVGKTTLLNKLFLKSKVKRNFLRSVSYTTRTQRPGEQQALDYRFISKKAFRALLKKNYFLEHQKVLDDYYGTPKECYQAAQKKNKNLIVCVDVKGGIYLKKHRKQDTIVTIFISVPHQQELHRRLKKRKEKTGTIKKRIQLAKKELQFVKEYDYLVINQNLKQSVELLEAILTAERLKRSKGGKRVHTG